MSLPVFLRAALLQGLAVALVAVVLGALLPRSFFVSWGWAAGPNAWLACAALTAAVLRLPMRPALLGGALAGLPSLVAVLAGVHWAGAPLAVVLFGLWCGRLAAEGRAPRRPVRVTG